MAGPSRLHELHEFVSLIEFIRSSESKLRFFSLIELIRFKMLLLFARVTSVTVTF